MKGSSTEFIINVKDEYSYRFESEHRNMIFDALKYVCWKKNRVNIPVYGIPDNLSDFQVTKNDAEEGKTVYIN